MFGFSMFVHHESNKHVSHCRLDDDVTCTTQYKHFPFFFAFCIFLHACTFVRTDTSLSLICFTLGQHCVHFVWFSFCFFLSFWYITTKTHAKLYIRFSFFPSFAQFFTFVKCRRTRLFFFIFLHIFKQGCCFFFLVNFLKNQKEKYIFVEKSKKIAL